MSATTDLFGPLRSTQAFRLINEWRRSNVTHVHFSQDADRVRITPLANPRQLPREGTVLTIGSEDLYGLMTTLRRVN